MTGQPEMESLEAEPEVTPEPEPEVEIFLVNSGRSAKH